MTTANGTAPKLNVHQRIAAVSAAVGEITKGSKTQQGKAAMGIQDVEEALGAVMAEHGLVTEWSYIDVCIRDEWRRGNESVFQARLKIEVVNADNPGDRISAEWTDVGSNPMAATSFTRKGYYKSLFHLAEKDDEGAPAAGGGKQKQANAEQGEGKQRRSTRSVAIEGRACPECGDQLAIVYRDGQGAFIGHTPYRRDGCKWRPGPEQERELRDAAPPDPSPLNPPQEQPDPVVEHIATAAQELTREQRHSLINDERWPIIPGESLRTWVGRQNAATRLTLTGEIGRLRTTETHPAPEPEAPPSAPSQNGAPAPQPPDREAREADYRDLLLTSEAEK
jgi:hypothetical protein